MSSEEGRLTVSGRTQETETVRQDFKEAAAVHNAVAFRIVAQDFKHQFGFFESSDAFDAHLARHVAQVEHGHFLKFGDIQARGIGSGFRRDICRIRSFGCRSIVLPLTAVLILLLLILAVSLRTLAVVIVIVIVIITAVVLIIVVVIVPALVVVLSRLETAALIVVLIVVIVVPAVIVIVIIVRVTLLPVVIVHLPALLIIITAALIVILIRGIVIIAAVISGSGLLLSGGIGILNRIGVRHRRRRIDISGGNRFGSRSIGVIGIVLRRAEGNRPDRFRGNDQQIRLGIFEKVSCSGSPDCAFRRDSE